MSQFKIGDEVTWTSQSAGRTKTKTGRVVEIVLPGSVPRLKGHGGKRDHTSYLVRASGRLYWPRVSHLTLAQWVLQEKLGEIISDGSTGVTCRTCKQDLANPGQLLRCREHHVAEIATQGQAIKTLEGKIQEMELHHAQHHHDEDNAQGSYEDLEKERDTLRAQVTELEQALEPGKASGIVGAVFALAHQYGMPQTSSEAPASFLNKLIMSLMAKSMEAMKTENVCVLHDGGTMEGCAGCFGSAFEKVEQLTQVLRDIKCSITLDEARDFAKRGLGEKT